MRISRRTKRTIRIASFGGGVVALAVGYTPLAVALLVASVVIR